MSDTKQAPVLEWTANLVDGSMDRGRWFASGQVFDLYVAGGKRVGLASGFRWSATCYGAERQGDVETLLEAQLAAEQCAREWLAEGLAKLTPVRKREAREAPQPCFATGCACWGKETP